MKIEIKNRFTGETIVSGEYDSLKDAVKDNKQNLSCSDLSCSDLSCSDLSFSNMEGSNLSDSNLSGSNLSGSNLSCSNLSRSNLSGSNLSCSNLSRSNLLGIKNYSENHDIFKELIKREKTEIFTDKQWSIIGIMLCHRPCWDTIKARWGKDFLPILEVLEKSGFGEYAVKYREVMK